MAEPAPGAVFTLEVRTWRGFGGIHLYGTIVQRQPESGDPVELSRPITPDFIDSLPADERRTYQHATTTTRFDSREELHQAAIGWMRSNAPAATLFRFLDWMSHQDDPLYDGRTHSHGPAASDGPSGQ